MAGDHGCFPDVPVIPLPRMKLKRAPRRREGTSVEIRMVRATRIPIPVPRPNMPEERAVKASAIPKLPGVRLTSMEKVERRLTRHMDANEEE
jgi:hypothetical protein